MNVVVDLIVKCKKRCGRFDYRLKKSAVNFAKSFTRIFRMFHETFLCRKNLLFSGFVEIYVGKIGHKLAISCVYMSE